MTEYYINPHYSQFAAMQPIVRSQGCTPTTGCNGADASTGGLKQVTPDEMWALVPIDQQSNPKTPGWSLIDLDKAMGKLSVPFTNMSGHKWTDVIDFSEAGYYIALQGDCDQFPGGCTGFLGNHCIGIHPEHSPDNNLRRVNEPTRSRAVFYSWSELRNYAVKFSGSDSSIYFGVFDKVVPKDMPKFVQANGYDTGSSKLLTVPKDSIWKYLDGTIGGTFTAQQKVQVFGLVDAASRHYLAEIFTSRPYDDNLGRTTLVLIESSAPLESVPNIPPSTLAARQAEWDNNAAQLIGPRPTT